MPDHEPRTLEVRLESHVRRNLPVIFGKFSVATPRSLKEGKRSEFRFQCRLSVSSYSQSSNEY